MPLKKTESPSVISLSILCRWFFFSSSGWSASCRQKGSVYLHTTWAASLCNPFRRWQVKPVCVWRGTILGHSKPLPLRDQYLPLLNFQSKTKGKAFQYSPSFICFSLYSGWLLSQMCYPEGMAFEISPAVFLCEAVASAGSIKPRSDARYIHQKLTAAKAVLSLAGFPVESLFAESGF